MPINQSKSWRKDDNSSEYPTMQAAWFGAAVGHSMKGRRQMDYYSFWKMNHQHFFLLVQGKYNVQNGSIISYAISWSRDQQAWRSCHPSIHPSTLSWEQEKSTPFLTQIDIVLHRKSESRKINRTVEDAALPFWSRIQKKMAEIL